MVSRLAIAALRVIITQPFIRPQSPSPFSQQGIATSTLYFSFFGRVKVIDAVADKVEGLGKDPLQKTRKTIEQEAQLTDQEWNSVRSISQDSNAATDANRKQSGDLLWQFKAQNPGLTSYPSELVAKTKALDRQLARIILDHVQQIRAALRETRFQQFDAYVHASVGPRLLSKTPPPPPNLLASSLRNG